MSNDSIECTLRKQSSRVAAMT